MLFLKHPAKKLASGIDFENNICLITTRDRNWLIILQDELPNVSIPSIICYANDPRTSGTRGKFRLSDLKS
jgi:hypothetical protein